MITLCLDLSCLPGNGRKKKPPTFNQYADFLEEMKGDTGVYMCSHEYGVDVGADFATVAEKDAYVAKVIEHTQARLGPGIAVTEWPFPDGQEMWNANPN
jgi:hypothetical protein